MQKASFHKLAFRLMAVLAVLGSLVLLGCPDDDNEEIRTVDATVALDSAANAAPLGGETFTFAGGVPQFGTAAATTVEFGADADTATISSGGETATSDVSYESCIFTITASTIPSLAVGDVITIDPCSYNVDSADVAVGGSDQDGTLVLIFNTLNSGPVTVPVSIANDGTLIVNDATTPIDTDVTGTAS